MGCSKKKLICRYHHESNGHNADLYKAVPQPIQNRQGDEAFEPYKGWKKMKRHLKKMKVFREFCQNDDKGGLYDAFIDEIERGKLSLHKDVDLLEQYWEPRVEYMKNCQIQDTPVWHKLLHVGNQVRELIEQLKIAWCFRKKRRNDYSRPKWLRQLEKWQKNGRKRNPQPQSSPSNSRSQKIHSGEDSCFWVRVEKVRKLLSGGGPSDNSERKKLVKVDRYVMGLIDKSAVSADIFLKNSTFMQWWSDSQGIWKKRMRGYVRHEQLVEFMEHPRENFMNRLI